MKTRLFRLLVVTTLSFTVSVAAAESLSLAAALAAARSHDPKYQAALREFESSQEYRIQGQAAWGPELSLGGGAAQNRLGQSAGAVSRTTNYLSKSLSLQVKQPLYSPELQARSREGEARSRQGEAALTEKTSQLIVRLLDAYADVPLADELLATASAQVLALREQLHSAERTRAKGEGTVTDELEARSRLAIAEADVLGAQNARQDALARFVLMVGTGAQPETRKLTPELTRLPLEPATLVAWQDMALKKNPSIEVRRQALQAATEGLGRVEAGKRPRVDLVAGVYRADSDSINTVNQSSLQRSVGIQFSMPIYDHGRNDSQARQAVAAEGAAQAQLDDIRETVLTELGQQFRALQSESQKVTAYAKALDAATLQVEATRRSVLGGIRVTLDVLNAQTQRFTVQQELTKARFNYFKAWFKLRAAAGVLDGLDLAMLDQQLQ